MSGQQDSQAAGDPMRLVQLAGGLLLALDVAMTASLYDRLPKTIAVHWSVTGVADNAGHRDWAWFGPMLLAFIAGLGLVTPRHTKPQDRGKLAGAVALASLYMFSVSMLLLLANLDNASWQQGSVGGRWMLLVLVLPGVVFAAGLCAYQARRGRRQVALGSTAEMPLPVAAVPTAAVPEQRPVTYWFPAKRYGWGWGIPRAWQGWTVVLSYCAVVLLATAAGRDARWTLPVVLVATVGVLLICLKKGEPTKWRWGGNE